MIDLLRRRRDARRFHALLGDSPLFDASWYLRTYEDVARSRLDPISHYLLHGAAEGRNPSPQFDTTAYQQANADVAASGINPLVHFILHGQTEGRASSPVFNGKVPTRRLPDQSVLRLRAQGRTFDTSLASPALDSIQDGALRWTYRGVRCTKDPFDLGLYSLLIERLRPRSVIEIGTQAGGSALWFADLLAANGVDGGRVVTVDVTPDVKQHDPRIKYLIGDARQLEDVVTSSLLETLDRPWLVIDDASHLEPDVSAVLEWAHPRLRRGDYLVIEDGILRHFADPYYDLYDDGPNRAVAAFMERYPFDYEVDTELCDWYGRNVTWNPNAWLRRR